MANKQLFTSKPGKTPRAADTKNKSGAKAYAFTPKHTLAQYACTGMLGSTYYVSAKQSLDDVLLTALDCDSAYLAKCAVYARKQGHMKDMPALLLAILAGRIKDSDKEKAASAKEYLVKAWPKVIDNDRMLRNFVQIVRSGQAGRKSLGTVSKRLIQQWFDSRTPDTIFRSSVGESPSLKDIIHLAHVRVEGTERTALQRYLLGYPTVDKNEKGYTFDHLPELVKHFEQFKKGENKTVPKIPFQMLTALELNTAQWTEIALNGGWQFVRMNLNTFNRHGVFKKKESVEKIASILENKEAIQKARVLPYQLLTAYLSVSGDMPARITNALQDALEHATNNVPELPGKTYIFPDVSGSMQSPVSGYRAGATTSAKYVDVAALFSAALLRKSPHNTHVIPVDTSLHHNVKLNPRDSVMTNAKKLMIGGGGTSLGIAMQYVADMTKHETVDTVIFVSDNESWADRGWGNHTLKEQSFQKWKSKNPKAKLINIDIAPHGTTQAKDLKDGVLNIGGFSDNIWPVIEAFVTSTGADFWVDTIEKINLDE